MQLNCLLSVASLLLSPPAISDHQKVEYFKAQNALGAAMTLVQQSRANAQHVGQEIEQKCGLLWEPRIIDGEPKCVLKVKTKK